jgi:hypothetical protein
LRAHYLAHAVARTSARSRTGMGCQHHCHRPARAGADLAATAIAPLVRVPSSQQPQGSLVRLSCGDQTRRRRPRRRQGRAAPPSPLGTFRRTPWATFKTAGGLLCTRGTTHRCGRIRSARIRCGPPLFSQATHRPSRQQAAPPATGSHAAANGGPGTARAAGGPSRTRDPGILCGWARLRVGFNLF